MLNKKLSVLICAKNEAQRIDKVLASLVMNRPDEIIVVDGGSTDETLKIAHQYTSNIIISHSGSLTKDRQIAVEAASNDLLMMLDADHILKEGQISELLADMERLKLDIVQSQLCSYSNRGFLNQAEGEFWDLTHNQEGVREMIGVAPAIYKREIFNYINFDSHITDKIDDTDFMYRLWRLKLFRVGVGSTKITQLHFEGLRDYIKKFMWYGFGDGQFMRKHPSRAISMLYHLGVRYILIYALRGLIAGKFKAVFFVQLQGIIRLIGVARYFVGNFIFGFLRR